MPSKTGAPGGAQTGQQVSHYIIDGGPFDRACTVLLSGGFAITWKSKSPASAARDEGGATLGKGGRREKYVCRNCGWQLWGKPGGRFLCINCLPPDHDLLPKLQRLCMEQPS